MYRLFVRKSLTIATCDSRAFAAFFCDVIDDHNNNNDNKRKSIAFSRGACVACDVLGLAAVCDVTMHCSAGGMRREDGSVRRQTVRSRSRLFPLKHLTLQNLAFHPPHSLPVSTR